MSADSPITVDSKGRLFFGGGGGLVPDEQARAYLFSRFPRLRVHAAEPAAECWRLAIARLCADVFEQRNANEQRKRELRAALEDLAGKTRPQLVELESTLVREMTTINRRLDAAKANPSPGLGSEWQNLALASLSYYHGDLKRVREALRRLPVEERPSVPQGLALAFYDAARRLLPGAQFHAIQQAAQAALCNE